MVAAREVINNHRDEDGGFSILDKNDYFFNQELNSAFEKYDIRKILASQGKNQFIAFGEEGMGHGMVTSLAGHDVYDDRITVFKDGKITEFYRANVDSTNTLSDANNSYAGYDGIKHYGTAKPGLYNANTYFRSGKKYKNADGIPRNDYLAVEVKTGNRDYVDQYDRVTNGINPNGNKRIVEYIRIHAGGAGWNWSHGCQTIFQNDYDAFRDLFWDTSLNNGKGGYNDGMTGFYFLLTQ